MSTSANKPIEDIDASVRCWFIGITDLDIVLETAVEEFGEVFALAAAT
jgi:hypothetical protein